MIITNNDIVGYWDFNQGSGTTLFDYSGNGNDGTITSATWDKINKQKQYALSFDGTTSNYVTTPASEDFELSSFTIIFKVKCNSTSIFHYPLTTYYRPDTNFRYGWFIQFNNDGTISVRGHGGGSSSTVFLDTTETYNTEEHTWALTYDGSNFALYRDGLDISGSTTSGTIAYPSGTNTSLYMGRARLDTIAGALDGTLTKVIIFDKVLSEDNIKSLVRELYSN